MLKLTRTSNCNTNNNNNMNWSMKGNMNNDHSNAVHQNWSNLRTQCFLSQFLGGFGFWAHNRYNAQHQNIYHQWNKTMMKSKIKVYYNLFNIPFACSLVHSSHCSFAALTPSRLSDSTFVFVFVRLLFVYMKILC